MWKKFSPDAFGPLGLYSTIVYIDMPAYSHDWTRWKI